MNSNFRNFAIWIIIGLLLVALFNLFQNPSQRARANEIPYSQFLAELDSQNIRTVTLSGNQLSGKYNDGRSFQTIVPNDPQLVDRLYSKKVGFVVKPAEDDVPSLLGVLVSWFPMLLLIAVWVFFMRQMQSGGGVSVAGDAPAGYSVGSSAGSTRMSHPPSAWSRSAVTPSLPTTKMST